MLEKLDRNVPILVYCTVGVRSNKLANTLLDKGFTEVFDMKDGIIGWSNAKFPIVNQDNELTDSVHVYSEYFGLLLKKGIPVY
jgi:predicted sulfurtransferase